MTVVFVPAGAKGPAFLTYNNFNTILNWNRSNFYAIAVGQRMRWREFQVVPSRESAVECLRVYYTLGETVIQLADYIRSLGWACTVEHPLGALGVAVKADEHRKRPVAVGPIDQIPPMRPGFDGVDLHD